MEDFGITEAYKTPLTSEQLAPRESLGLTTSPFGVRIKRTNINIPGLLRSAVKALMLEIAYLETGNDNTYNQDNRYGKYAVHKNTLTNFGYLSADGSAWTDKEGISDTAGFLASTRLQDRIMERFLVEQYVMGINVGSIKDNDSIATVASMLAVAYQFQDYVYSITEYDSSYLVSTAANLSTNLANTLSTLGYANVAKSHYDNSGLSTLASDFTQSLSFSTVNNEVQKRMYAIVQDINDTSLVTTQTVESALYGNIEGRNKQLAISLAQTSITTLNNKINNTYQNLPAIRAKQWRSAGNINDSRGRPGALFFNAGKYAVDVLDADVVTG